ncbi:hypothetical protein EDC04DRAFT_2892132 [Pisolithus marmoratus]|nr:hypothetical protein EDC04DRAFT_2892132 [Pisolithus marmoratus]
MPCDLIKAITTSTTEYVNDVLLFLWSRSWMSIETQITKMHETVTAFSGVLEVALKNCKRLLFIDGELSNSDQHRDGRYSGNEPSSPQIMHDLLADITAKVRVFNPRDTDLLADL